MGADTAAANILGSRQITYGDFLQFGDTGRVALCQDRAELCDSGDTEPVTVGLSFPVLFGTDFVPVQCPVTL